MTRRALRPLMACLVVVGLLWGIAPSAHAAGGQLTWVSSTAPNAAEWDAVAYGNGIWVAVSNTTPATTGTTYIMTSTDGVTWTSRTAPDNGNYRSVTYGNGRFVAVGSTAKAIYSTDGITWTAAPMVTHSGAPNNFYSVIYGAGLFVAVGGPGNQIQTSSDGGATWAVHDSTGTANLRGVANGNGIFVAVASNTGTQQALWSADGLTWTAAGAVENNTWSSVAFGAGQFVAVASTGTNRVMTSTDGVTWIPRQASSAELWRSVAYGNGIWTAIAGDNSVSGAGGAVMTSTDGITWTSGTPTSTTSWQDVAYGNGLFVAVSTSGQIMTAVAELAYPGGTAIRQGLPLNSHGSCDNLQDAEFAYGSGVKGGWQRGWEPWPNEGRGGWACIRALVNSGGAWYVNNSTL